MTRRSVYMRLDGRWSWRLLDNDYYEIASGGPEGYSRQTEAEVMADKIMSGEFADAEKVVIRPTT